uniref:Monosaccharide-sensing protein 2-like n=1 Tax=Rhizophora mucronata TaxID=61149 RepID=A0A2P2IPE4_RHIMU
MHCNMCPYLLDWQYNCHIFAPRDAQISWSCWCIWVVRSCVHHSIGVCLLESSRNQAHAT